MTYFTPERKYYRGQLVGDPAQVVQQTFPWQSVTLDILPSDGQVPAWSGALQKYIPITLPTGSGSGDVTGPASSTLDNIALFADATGKVIKDSGVQLSSKQNADATLTALAGLDNTLGLLEQIGPDLFAKRAIGVAAPTDIPSRADGDGRYLLASSYAPIELPTWTVGSQANPNTSLVTITNSSLALGVGWYRVQWTITYGSDASTTGSWFSVGGTAAHSYFSAVVQASASTGDNPIGVAFTSYNAGTPTTSTRTPSPVNVAVIDLLIKTTAAGTVFARFASEVAGSNITVVNVAAVALRM